MPHENFVKLLDSENVEIREFASDCLARSKTDELVKELAVDWKGATVGKSVAIRKIMARKPTAVSLQALREWRRGRGYADKIRYRASRASFRFAYFPISLMVLAILGLPLLMLLTYHVVLANITEANALVTFIVRNKEAGIELRTTVANFVADKSPNHHMTPKPLADTLASLPSLLSDSLASDSLVQVDKEEDESRTVFEELKEVQADEDETCYIKIGLVQSLAIAVSRLQEDDIHERGAGASTRVWSWPAAEKRKLFEKPLGDINKQIREEDCWPPDRERYKYMIENWWRDGSKATQKALRALNTMATEVPAALGGGTPQVRELARLLQISIIDGEIRRQQERDALNVLAYIYLLNNDIELDWTGLISKSKQSSVEDALNQTRERLRWEKEKKPFKDIEPDRIDKRAAEGLAKLGIDVAAFERPNSDEAQRESLQK